MNYREFVTELATFCNKYKLNREEVYISHGGAMLVYGYRDDTSDIDVAVSQEVWNMFVGKYGVKVVHNPTTELVEIPGMKVDVHLLTPDFVESDYHVINHVKVTTIAKTLANKLELSRDKDLEDIAILKDVISHKADDVIGTDQHGNDYTYEEAWELEHDLWYDAYQNEMNDATQDDYMRGGDVNRKLVNDIFDKYRLIEPVKYFV